MTQQTVTETATDLAAGAVVETQKTTAEQPDGTVEEVLKTTIVNGDAAAADEAADMIEAEAADTTQAAAHTAEAVDGIEPTAAGEAAAAQVLHTSCPLEHNAIKPRQWCFFASATCYRACFPGTSAWR